MNDYSDKFVIFKSQIKDKIKNVTKLCRKVESIFLEDPTTKLSKMEQDMFDKAVFDLSELIKELAKMLEDNKKFLEALSADNEEEYSNRLELNKILANGIKFLKRKEESIKELFVPAEPYNLNEKFESNEKYFIVDFDNKLVRSFVKKDSLIETLGNEFFPSSDIKVIYGKMKPVKFSVEVL